LVLKKAETPLQGAFFFTHRFSLALKFRRHYAQGIILHPAVLGIHMAQPIDLKNYTEESLIAFQGQQYKKRYRCNAFPRVRLGMIHLFTAVLFLICTSMVQAQIYQWRDEQGNLHFSDTAPENSESRQRVKEIEVNPVFTVPAYKVPVESRSKEKKHSSQPIYKHFRINQPTDDSTLRDNAGDVTVALSVDPPLRRQDSIVLFMDDRQVAEGQQTRFQLSNIDRGTHTLFAEIRGHSGEKRKRTDPVEFSLLRASIIPRPSP
jgi:hypothetical protein